LIKDKRKVKQDKTPYIAWAEEVSSMRYFEVSS
jgi:hypothetical protein